jgi:N-methylhydantoinase B
MDQGFELQPGDEFVCKAAGGGGWGDPLDRIPAAVEHDVEAGRVTEAEAREVYGVIPGDPAATAETRQSISDQRLAAARPAPTPLADSQCPEVAGAPAPLAPGVEQRGQVAFSVRSGAPLAIAPDHWTDGCPVLVQTIGDQLERRAYLDPGNGHMLHVEIAPAGEPRSFESRPARWSSATA